jgi:hypothetical protein
MNGYLRYFCGRKSGSGLEIHEFSTAYPILKSDESMEWPEPLIGEHPELTLSPAAGALI